MMENSIPNPCPSCGKQMTMYYKLHCFHCYKPENVVKTTNNLLLCIKWLEVNEPLFNKDKFWNSVCEDDFTKGDWHEFVFDENDEMPEQWKLFNKHFPVKDVLWEINW